MVSFIASDLVAFIRAAETGDAFYIEVWLPS
jgi:hypothetical protein